MKTTKNLLMLIVVAVLVLAACANQQEQPVQETPVTALSSDAIIGEGNLKPVYAANLSFQVRGVVEDINVKIGDTVSKGDVLARLSNASQAEAQLAAANLELVDAQQAMDALVRTGGATLAEAWTSYLTAQEVRAEAEREWEDVDLDQVEDDVEDARADLEDIQEDLDDAQEEFDKYKDLDKDNSKRETAEEDLERAQEDYNEAVRDLEELTRESDSIRAALDAAIASETEAKHQYEISANGVNAEQLALAEARLENAKAQVAAAESTLNNYIITAPFDGVVVDVAVEIGEQVTAESRAASIADTSSWIIETTDITELEVVDIAVGQAVTFTADALPDVTMEGVVTAVSESSFTQSGDVIYTVYIQADEVDPRVKWGMTVEVTFEAAE